MMRARWTRVPGMLALSPSLRFAPQRIVFVSGLLLMFAVLCTPGWADKPVPVSELAVDVVSIKGGPRLSCAVLGREDDGKLALAVRRDWLKQAHPQLYDQAAREETAETKAALTELRDRIAEWRKTRADVPELDFFLKKEAERIDKDLKALAAGRYQESAPFMLLDFPQAKLERVVTQAPARRAVAQAAWQEQLAHVETRSAASLTQELKQKQVAPIEDADELLDLLPARRESESAWVARKALVEYQLRKPLDFQGTGDFVFPASEKLDGAPGAKLIEGLLKSLTSGALKDLFEQATGAPGNAALPGASEKWLASAAQSATSAGVSGFRVTRVDQNLEAQQIRVETRFVAQFPDRTWRTVWSHTEKADASKPRADQEQQILQDPQVRKVLELVRSVGLTGDDQIKLAIRFGAATMDCQKTADSRFFQFRDRYLRRLNGPVLRVGTPATKKIP